MDKKKMMDKFPLLRTVAKGDEIFWNNSNYQPNVRTDAAPVITYEDILDAEARLQRFAPYLAEVFPETQAAGGMIESPIIEMNRLKKELETREQMEFEGDWFLKCDNELPISGSIKARGGIYEVLKHAEELAIQHELLHFEEDYAKLANESFVEFFSRYSIAVGSTGNLGLSIGIMSAKLGFNVTVHMSSDAKEWKKNLLRSKGVTVIEYRSDYSKAVEEGRKQADEDERCYFIDDENSTALFLGYAVAALRLKQQMQEKGIKVDEEHPLFVYLPCGVGGGPGGVAYGLKALFHEHVHCFFAEPTQSPCMLIGLMTRLHDQISVFDLGLTNQTAADGLAVGRASTFAGKLMEPLLSGVYTVEDKELFHLLKMMVDTEHLYLEPSALAGAAGPYRLQKTREGQDYLNQHRLLNSLKKPNHVMWATGGSMVPDEVRQKDYEQGKKSPNNKEE